MTIYIAELFDFTTVRCVVNLRVRRAQVSRMTSS
jgi:hypothetical protein